MPALRDFSQNYISTTGLGLTSASPETQANDLLLALVTADTGSQSWFGGDQISYAFYDDGGVFTDETADANSDATADIFLLPATPAVNDAFYFATTAGEFTSVIINISTAGAGTWTLTWEYYNGSAWVTLPSVTDGTTNYRAGTGYQTARWQVPTDWASTTVNSVSAKWVRARVSAYTSITTRPVATRIFIGTWQQLLTTTNTANLGFVYKIAGASEAADYAFSFTTTETANALVMSIRDVDTSLPFATSVYANYAESNQDSNLSLNNSTTAISQSFTGAGGPLASVKFYLKKVGSATGNAVAKLYAHSGTFGTSSVPTGAALSKSANFNVSTLTTSYQLIEFTFPWNYALVNATNYCIVLEYTGTATDYIDVGYDASTPSHGGNKATFASAVWTAQSGHDVCFSVQRFTFNTGTTSAIKANLPTMTTSRDNSLVVYAVSNSGAGTTPSIIEGPCTLIVAKDGGAHSDGAAWGFLKTAGTTPSNVGVSQMGTGSASALAVLAVNPPSTGATVIPGYCVSDSSVYISPMTGATYNSDIAPVNTVTSAFGTSLNGKTLSAGGTTYTRADTGINTYHASANCLGITTANTWSGVRLTFAASKDLSNKNVLLHLQPYLPIDIQTTDSVTLDGTMGVAVGFGSTANTNYKVWHVHGANSIFGVQRMAPIVIHPSYAGAGLIQNTGSLNAAAVVELGVMVSCKVVAASWLFASMWALDTTVVAGGLSAEPLGIAGIVSAAATGHERRSVIQQGAAQFMIFQPVQIGDGGTSPVYLSLDGTALEFPRQYDKASKNVGYCSIDNVCGLKYYAGSSDTIIHRNSVISSASRYHWGLHSSSSTSATYDFSGLSVIGAGTITLNRAITITGLTINDYSTIDASSLTLNDSTIKNPPTSNDSITTNASTNIDNCVINVSTVSSGNRWCSVADPSIFSGCAFTGGGGHAIRITTAGTYSLVGNTFTGFGADGTNGAAIYNDSGGSVTLNISGGGSVPTIRNGTSASTTVNNTVDLTVEIRDSEGTLITEACEVTVVRTSDTTELYHVESVVSGSTTYSYNYVSDTTVYINVVNVASYVPKTVEPVVLGSADQTVVVQLESERGRYSNP